MPLILILILLVSNNQPQDRDPHNRSVGSNAAASGGHCGIFRTTRISQRQNSHPDKVKNAAARARCNPWWLSKGDSTPATSAFNTRLVKACSDEDDPRWRGYMSRIA